MFFGILPFSKLIFPYPAFGKRIFISSPCWWNKLKISALVSGSENNALNTETSQQLPIRFCVDENLPIGGNSSKYVSFEISNFCGFSFLSFIWIRSSPSISKTSPIWTFAIASSVVLKPPDFWKKKKMELFQDISNCR